MNIFDVPYFKSLEEAQRYLNSRHNEQEKYSNLPIWTLVKHYPKANEYTRH